MGFRGSLHTCVLKVGRFAQHLFRVLTLAALATSCTTLLQAQTPTATVTPVAYAQQSNGALQAGDRNFYSTSLPLFQNCNTDPNSLCAYIYMMTPAGLPSIVHTFGPIPTGTTSNKEGLWPTALIVGTDGFLYGACKAGGSVGLGTIFKVDPANPDPTTNLTVIKDFGVTGNRVDPGNQPVGLIQGSDGNLYFTNGLGLYELTLGANGGTVLTIYTFPTDPNTQALTQGGNANSLVQGSDGNFYLTLSTAPTTAVGQGTQGAIAQITPGGAQGWVFALPADGSLGDVPIGPLTEGPGGVLYGVTKYSGNSIAAGGWAFSITTGGAYILLPHQFPGSTGRQYDGALFLGSDGNLYGTTLTGGDLSSTNCSPIGCGTFYQLTTSGAYTELHDFEGGAPNPQNAPLPPIVDGASPTTPVVQADTGDFYGTGAGNAKSVPIVYKASITPTPVPPVQLTFDQPEVIPGDPINLTWTVLNAYSLTAQQCGASIVGKPAGAGTWSGPQIGVLDSAGNYTGSAVITPTANGIYTYALTCGGKESGFVTLKARDNSLLVPIPPTAAQLQATVSDTQLYQLDLTANGGSTPYTWKLLSGQLPPGLSLDGSGTIGVISGFPQQFGQYSFVVEVDDASPAALQQTESITITVNSGLNLVPNLFNPVLNVAYRQSVAPDTSGGLTPYTWNVTGGQLPTGLTLDTKTGAITGTPTAPGTYTFTITVSDFESTPAKFPAVYILKVAGPLQVLTGVLTPAAVGVPYTTKLAATGGVLQYQWALASNNPPGSVPQGLSLASDGTFGGIPTQYTIPAGGSNTFNVIVTDSSTPNKLSTQAQITIAVASTLKIQSAGSLNGTVGVTSSVPLVATGGVPPYTFTATATPPNVTLQVIGNTLQYVPSVAGVVNITVAVQDSETFPATASDNTGSLTVVSPQVPTTTALTSSLPTAGTGQIVTLTAKVTQLSGSVTPTGQVTFFNGVITLGTATLGANGMASIQTSFAVTGVYNITAAYSGDGTHTGSVSPSLAETVITPGISAAISPASLTVKAGSSGQFVITVTPFGGYTGNIGFSCGAVPKATTCSFRPPSIAITAAGGPFTTGLAVSTKAGRRGTPAGTYAIPVTITVPGGASKNVGGILRVR